MTGRVLRIGLMLAVLALLVFVASKLSFEEVKVPVPLRGEAARNPFYAAIRLSDLLGAEGSWERVFTLPPANGVVFVSNWNWSVSRTRRELLQKWVESGGRLIVDDSVTADIEQFESWSGINQLDHEQPNED